MRLDLLPDLTANRVWSCGFRGGQSVLETTCRSPQSAARRLNSIDPSRTALVLGSSFLGVYAHAGFLNGIDQAGFRPGRLVGASAGALAGSLYAFGLRGDALRSAAIDLQLRRSFLDAGALLRLPGVITSLWASGVFSGKRTVSHLRRIFDGIDLSQLEVPLDIAVTDTATSKLEIRRNGPLAECVMASCAVPILFEIQNVDGKTFLDGGIAGELPFEHLVEDPSLDTVILHRIRHERNSTPWFFRKTVGHAIGVTWRTISRDVHRLRVQQAGTSGKRLIEIETLTPFPGLFTHRLAASCYERGFDSGGNLGFHLAAQG
jgi:predicted acylesterase/phospholipase RssA